MVNKAMEELGNCHVIIKNSKRISNPRIVIKIKEYVYNCRFLSPQKLCNYFNKNTSIVIMFLIIKRVKQNYFIH